MTDAFVLFRALPAKRANEYNELSHRLMKCQSSADLLSEQARFYSIMGTDYAEEATRLFDLIADLVRPNKTDGAVAIA